MGRSATRSAHSGALWTTTQILRTSSPPRTGTQPAALSDIIRPLSFYGGTTQTHALSGNESPAVDAINDGSPPLVAVDQRGVVRPHDGNHDGGLAPDIGSFERKGPRL
jgi:hypothetical protein